MQVVVFNSDAASQGSLLLPVTDANKATLITYINAISTDMISETIWPGGVSNMDLAMKKVFAIIEGSLKLNSTGC